jgi:hypothetical protein
MVKSNDWYSPVCLSVCVEQICFHKILYLSTSTKSVRIKKIVNKIIQE